MRRGEPPLARATASATLEWKKRADAWIGVPLAWLCGMARRLSRARAATRDAPPREPRHVVVAKLWGIYASRI